MDLNHQYFEHQLSLMRASAAVTRLARTRHLAAAGVTAYRISNHQSGIGADAADGWVRSLHNLDLWIYRDLGIAS
ncbi:MAG: hypothetical protein IE913_05615 [Halothiobacillus sp.]|nr:hypothetical protein [Halothiobacillus sp.]